MGYISRTIGSLVLVGGLAWGIAETRDYMQGEFCKEYGHLRDAPKSVQLQHANQEFDESTLSESLRGWSNTQFLNCLKECK